MGAAGAWLAALKHAGKLNGNATHTLRLCRTGSLVRGGRLDLLSQAIEFVGESSQTLLARSRRIKASAHRSDFDEIGCTKGKGRRKHLHEPAARPYSS